MFFGAFNHFKEIDLNCSIEMFKIGLNCYILSRQDWPLESGEGNLFVINRIVLVS